MSTVRPELRCATLVVGLLFVVAVGHVRAQHEPEFTDRGVVGLELALRRLGTDASLLYITAHPDDEDNGLLAKLCRRLGVRVGVLSLTRGEGGQNEIGPELSNDLAVLRSGELLAARRLDGAEQYFGRNVDFGYSFSVEETFAKWDEERTVGDVVRVIREFRPDVVVTLRPDGAGGGQHHQASARLATRAFLVAGDPERFPEQISAERLRPWQPRKLYRALWRPNEEQKAGAVEIQLGDYDPVLGMSYAELGAIARRRHRCQGMNAPPVPGPQSRWYRYAAEVVQPVAAGEGLLDGIARDLVARPRDLRPDVPAKDLPDLTRLAGLIDECEGALRAGEQGRLAALAMAGLAEVRQLRSGLGGDPWQPGKGLGVAPWPRELRRLNPFLYRQERKWLEFAARAHGLQLEATLGPDERDGLVVGGEPFAVRALLVCRGRQPVRVLGVELDSTLSGYERIEGGERQDPRALGYNDVYERSWRIAISRDAPITTPGWRPAPDGGRTVTGTERGERTQPFPPPVFGAIVAYESAGVRAHLRVPVVYRWYDAAVGQDRSYAVKVVPAVSVRLEPDLLVIPAAAARRSRELTAHIRLDQRAAAAVGVRLELPDGWRADPPARTVQLDGGREAALRFTVEPPADITAGRFELRAVARLGEATSREGYRTVAYHHVETRHVYSSARTDVRVVDVSVPEGLRVGYVKGVGDRVPAAIRQLGVAVEMLGEEDLAAGDLARFDTIVLGIRAYKDRRDLRAHNQRLLDWVRGGGALIVQYNKYEFHEGAWAPFPARIRRPHDRVTDETAPVRALVPEHPLLRWPNRIGPADWDGWVQERGLYFWGDWDERYTPILAMADPFPYNSGEKRGALVIARFDQGFYVYTGLGLFRQLPAGVSGAYRLLANLLAVASDPAKERE